MTAKWTDFPPTLPLLVATVQSGGNAQAAVDKFNRLYGPPAIAAFRNGNELVLAASALDLAYPLMDLALREGIGIVAQTRTPLLLRPDDLAHMDVLTPVNVERLHVRKVESYLQEPGCTLDWVCDLHPRLYQDESLWLTSEGRGLVKTISALRPVIVDPVDDEHPPIIIDIVGEEEEEEETEPLDSESVCVLCIVARPKSINLPCECIVFCRKCAEAANRPVICPICKKDINCVITDDS